MIRLYEMSEEDYNLIEKDSNNLYFVNKRIYKGAAPYGDFILRSGDTMYDNATLNMPKGTIALTDNTSNNTINANNIILSNGSKKLQLTNNSLQIIDDFTLNINKTQFEYSNTYTNLILNQNLSLTGNNSTFELQVSKDIFKYSNNKNVILNDSNNLDLINDKTELILNDDIFSVLYDNNNVLTFNTSQLVYNIDDTILTITKDNITQTVNDTNWLNISNSNELLLVKNNNAYIQITSSYFKYNNNDVMLYVGDNNYVSNSIFGLGTTNSYYSFSKDCCIYGFNDSLDIENPFDINEASLIINNNGFRRINNDGYIYLDYNLIEANNEGLTFVKMTPTISTIATQNTQLSLTEEQIKLDNDGTNIKVLDNKITIGDNNIWVQIDNNGIKQQGEYIDDIYRVHTYNSLIEIDNIKQDALYRVGDILYIGEKDGNNMKLVQLYKSSGTDDISSLRARVQALEEALSMKNN